MAYHNVFLIAMFAVNAKIYRVIYNQSSSINFDETSSYAQHQKAPNFSAFHWSPHASLVSIGQHFVTTRVVHFPKRTETNSITDLITESDQAVRAVHSCNSWLWIEFSFDESFSLLIAFLLNYIAGSGPFILTIKSHASFRVSLILT